MTVDPEGLPLGTGSTVSVGAEEGVPEGGVAIVESLPLDIGNASNQNPWGTRGNLREDSEQSLKSFSGLLAYYVPLDFALCMRLIGNVVQDILR